MYALTENIEVQQLTPTKHKYNFLSKIPKEQITKYLSNSIKKANISVN